MTLEKVVDLIAHLRHVNLTDLPITEQIISIDSPLNHFDFLLFKLTFNLFMIIIPISALKTLIGLLLNKYHIEGRAEVTMIGLSAIFALDSSSKLSTSITH